MPSVLVARLEPRERRTVLAGAIVIAAAILVAFVVMPYARRVAELSARADAARERVVRLRGAMTRETEMRRTADSLDAALDAGGVRLMRARSEALIAAGMQALLQEYATSSQVGIQRLDVAGAPVSDSLGSGLQTLPATVSAVGDIYGLVEFLGRLQEGLRYLEVRELSVAPNPALRGNLLNMTFVVRGPYLLEDE